MSVACREGVFCLRLLVSGISARHLFRLGSGGGVDSFVRRGPSVLRRLSSVRSRGIVSLVRALKVVFGGISVRGISRRVLECIFRGRYCRLGSAVVHEVIRFRGSAVLSNLSAQGCAAVVSLKCRPLVGCVRRGLGRCIGRVVLTFGGAGRSIRRVVSLLREVLRGTPRRARVYLRLIGRRRFYMSSVYRYYKGFSSSFSGSIGVL